MREFFERMPEDLSGGLHRRTFCKGEPVLLAGEENRCIYMVERGTAMAWVADESGATALVDRYGEGDLFGELEIFCEGLKTIEVVAASDCTVLQLDRDDLQNGWSGTLPSPPPSSATWRSRCGGTPQTPPSCSSCASRSGCAPACRAGGRWAAAGRWTNRPWPLR